MTATMFVVIRENGYGKPQYITLPLVTALVDREKYFTLTDELPEDIAPEPPPLPPRLIPREHKPHERKHRQPAAAGAMGSKGKKAAPIGQGLSFPERGFAGRIARRLQQHFPEVAAALARGEYSSAEAAGIAAGIIKPPAPSLTASVQTT